MILNTKIHYITKDSSLLELCFSLVLSKLEGSDHIREIDSVVYFCALKHYQNSVVHCRNPRTPDLYKQSIQKKIICEYLSRCQAIQNGHARIQLVSIAREVGPKALAEFIKESCDLSKVNATDEAMKVIVSGIGTNFWKKDLETELEKPLNIKYEIETYLYAMEQNFINIFRCLLGFFLRNIWQQL